MCLPSRQRLKNLWGVLSWERTETLRLVAVSNDDADAHIFLLQVRVHATHRLLTVAVAANIKNQDGSCTEGTEQGRQLVIWSVGREDLIS